MSILGYLENLYHNSLREKFRPVRLLSFEIDLDSFDLANANKKYFKHLRHAAPDKLLQEGSWQAREAPITWTLIHGDFKSNMTEASLPHIIIYDPFSSRTDHDMWSFEHFKRLYALCEQHDTELFTYSSSTAIRASLLAAGFYVARGLGTGTKKDTTIALTKEKLAKRDNKWKKLLLGQEWISQWQRSSAAIPGHIEEKDAHVFKKLVENHFQFNGLHVDSPR